MTEIDLTIGAHPGQNSASESPSKMSSYGLMINQTQDPNSFHFRTNNINQGMFNNCNPQQSQSTYPNPPGQKNMMDTNYIGTNQSGSMPTDPMYMYSNNNVGFMNENNIARRNSTKEPKERRFACEEPGCSKRFSRKFTLKEHMKTHTGARPYACDHEGCTSKFSTSGNLSRHKFTHTGEKPFMCQIGVCRKRFCTKEKLNRHIKTHSGLRPFLCKIPGCHKRFSTSGNLGRHMKSHKNSSFISRDGCINPLLIGGGDYSSSPYNIPSKKNIDSSIDSEILSALEDHPRISGNQGSANSVPVSPPSSINVAQFSPANRISLTSGTSSWANSTAKLDSFLNKPKKEEPLWSDSIAEQVDYSRSGLGLGDDALNSFIDLNSGSNRHQIKRSTTSGPSPNSSSCLPPLPIKRSQSDFVTTRSNNQSIKIVGSSKGNYMPMANCDGSANDRGYSENRPNLNSSAGDLCDPNVKFLNNNLNILIGSSFNSPANDSKKQKFDPLASPQFSSSTADFEPLPLPLSYNQNK